MTAYEMEMPTTIEAARRYLQACETSVAVALELAADARRHLEMLLQQPEVPSTTRRRKPLLFLVTPDTPVWTGRGYGRAGGKIKGARP